MPVETENHVEVLERCLASPVGKEPLSEFLENINQLVVIVSDGTRSTPTAKVLDVILPTISVVPDLRFIVATGTHQAPAEDDLRYIFGRHLDDLRDMIVFHDSRNDSELEFVGRTAMGHEVCMNRLVVGAERILAIGNVEPHYFAGYSGGRKSFLPGVSSFAAVEKNHSLALSPDSATLATDGNPVHDEMMSATDLLGTERIFTIQTVLSDTKEIYAAYCGDLHLAWRMAVECAESVYCCPLEERGDIVLAALSPPRDATLYQAQKALEIGKLALKDGGIFIWSARCDKGIGDATFLELLFRADGYESVREELETGYRLGYHKAAKILQLNDRADIWLISDIDDETVSRAGIRPFHDLQKAIGLAISNMRGRGVNPRVIIIPKADICVPKPDK